MRRPSWIAAAFVVFGCSSPDEPARAEPVEAGVVKTESCERNPGEVYVAGIERTSSDGRLRLAIVDAIPAPPERGDNTWTVKVLAAPEDAPPTVEVVDTHGNVPLERARVTAIDPASKTYKIDKLSLPIPGAWGVTFRVGSSDAGSMVPSVTFRFCVGG